MNRQGHHENQGNNGTAETPGETRNNMNRQDAKHAKENDNKTAGKRR